LWVPEDRPSGTLDLPKAREPVLVVDDDAVSRLVLCQALDQAEISNIAVADGHAALEVLKNQVPSLVLLDLVMPQPDGYEVLRTLRADPRTQDVPVVVLTALDADEEVSRAFEAGTDDFLRKPFKPAELIARVRGQFRLRAVKDQLAGRERDAQVVLELTKALASNLDFRGILFTVVQRIAAVARVDRVSVVLVREQGDVGYVVAASDNEQLRDLPIDLAKYPEIRESLATAQPLVISDAETHPLLELTRNDAPARWTFRSLLILPIIYEKQAMGVLFLRGRQRGVFGEREVALCNTVSSAMAIALRNARVLQSLRDQTQQVTVARFEAERRLKSLQRYADFFESAADGIIVIDAEGRLLFTNPRARGIFGRSEEDLAGRALPDVFVFGDAQASQALLDGFREGIFPQGLDMALVTREGRPLVASVNFTSVAREEGVVLCSFRDVTQERAVEAELVKTKDSLQRVIDSSFDAIVSADTRGTIVLFNRAAERLFGRVAREVLGTDIRLLYPDGTAERIMKLVRRGGGRVEGLRLEILHAATERIPVSFSGALVYEGGTIVGSVGIFTDLREKMRMEERLQQAQEQLLAQERQAIIAELAGAAAHELNQPLQSVMAYAQLLERRLPPPSSQQTAASGVGPHAAVAVIYSEAARMAEIVRKIGRITRYETKSYVGAQKILDLDRASVSETGEHRVLSAASLASTAPTSNSSIPPQSPAPSSRGARLDTAPPSHGALPSERANSTASRGPISDTLRPSQGAPRPPNEDKR
jgi:PAS domain S-box-containing protein